jgi:glycosyltransferase involved in cell wall biosynthesis
MRGGEKVLAELVRLLPSADLFTLMWNRGSVAPEIEARIRQVSFLQSLPQAAQAYRYYLPLFPAAIRSIDLRGYDLVVSSSHAVAKSVRVPPGAMHISYVHTPMRYIWNERADYFRFGRWRRCRQAGLALAAPWLRRFDVRTTATVDTLVANSQNVRKRIRLAYGRDAAVVYPPVDTAYFTPGRAASEGYYLVAGALEPYKRVDLVIEAFSGGPRRLVIAGRGSLAGELRRMARPPVEFLGEVSDAELRELYRCCRALVFAGCEDFGMVMVEAQACGRPVVCFGKGGAREAVLDGRTGLFFREQSTAAVVHAIEEFESRSWNPSLARAHSLHFSRDRFREGIGRIFSAHGLDSPHLAAKAVI